MRHRCLTYLYGFIASFVIGFGLSCVGFGTWHGVHDVIRLVSTARDLPGVKRYEDVQVLPELAYRIRLDTERWYETSATLKKPIIFPIKLATEWASDSVGDLARGSPDKAEDARRLLGRIAWLLNAAEPEHWKSNQLYQRLCANAMPTSPKIGWIISCVIVWHLATLGSFAVLALHLRARIRTLYGNGPQPTPMGVDASRIKVNMLPPNPILLLEPGWRAFFARKLFHSQSHRSSLMPTQMFSSPIIRIITGTYWLTEACVEPGSEMLIGGAKSSDATLEISVPKGEFIYVKPATLIGYMVSDTGRPLTLLSGIFKNFWWGADSNPPMLFTGPCKVYLRAHALEANHGEAVPANQLLWFSLAKPPTLVNSRPGIDVGSLLQMGLFIRKDPSSGEALWVDRRMLPGSLRILGKLFHLVIFLPLIAWLAAAF